MEHLINYKTVKPFVWATEQNILKLWNIFFKWNILFLDKFYCVYTIV